MKYIRVPSLSILTSIRNYPCLDSHQKNFALAETELLDLRTQIARIHFEFSFQFPAQSSHPRGKDTNFVRTNPPSAGLHTFHPHYSSANIQNRLARNCGAKCFDFLASRGVGQKCRKGLAAQRWAKQLKSRSPEKSLTRARLFLSPEIIIIARPPAKCIFNFIKPLAAAGNTLGKHAPRNASAVGLSFE